MRRFLSLKDEIGKGRIDQRQLKLPFFGELGYLRVSVLEAQMVTGKRGPLIRRFLSVE